MVGRRDWRLSASAHSVPFIRLSIAASELARSLAPSLALSLGRRRSLHRANMDGVIRRHKSRKDGRERAVDVWQHGEGARGGIGGRAEETLLHALVRWQ